MLERVHLDHGPYSAAFAVMGDAKQGENGAARCQDRSGATASPSERKWTLATAVAHRSRQVQRLTDIEQGSALRHNVDAGADLARTNAEGYAGVRLIWRPQTLELLLVS